MGVVVVEDQAIEVAGQILDNAGGMGVGSQILAALSHHIDTALVDQLIPDGAGQEIG